MLINLTKEELCLISIALNAYQMETDNYHLEEIAEVSTKIDGLYKVCTCRESIVADDFYDSLSEGKDQPQPVEEASTIHRRRDLDLL